MRIDGEITTKGLVVSVIAWFAFTAFMASQAECVKYDTCGAGDMLLFAVIAIGMLVPARILGQLVSGIFD
jgi:hypothetical protein